VEAHLGGDGVGFQQGHVGEEQARHALALAIRRLWPLFDNCLRKRAPARH
jgi:hypothetical protein